MILSDREMVSLTTYATTHALSIEDAASQLFSEALATRFAPTADKPKAKVYEIGAARGERLDKPAAEDGNAKA